MKYAQINRETVQMVGRPQELPERFVTPEGSTISFFNKFPNRALAALDWLPVAYESLPGPETHAHSLTPEIVNEQFVYKAIPRDLETLRDNALMTINETANHVTRVYVPVGGGRSYNAMLKRDEACVYLLAENPDLANFPIIKNVSEKTGRLPDEIAVSFQNQIGNWTLKIAEIEGCREKSLIECGNAKTHEEIIDRRNTALAELEII